MVCSTELPSVISQDVYTHMRPWCSRYSHGKLIMRFGGCVNQIYPHNRFQSYHRKGCQVSDLDRRIALHGRNDLNDTNPGDLT